jgi:hypothetical protein
MDTKTDNKLELAVMRWVDGLDMDSLVQIVSEDIYEHYRKNATDQEVLEFIEDMQVTDEDV